MQISVMITVEPLESWQRHRLNAIVEKLRKELEGIQYVGDSEPFIDYQQVKPDAQVDAEREADAPMPTLSQSGALNEPF